MEANNSSKSQEKIVTQENKDNKNNNNTKKQQTPPPPPPVKGGVAVVGGQQPWVPAPMVMQHPMMAPPHYHGPPFYMPYHHQSPVMYHHSRRWQNHQNQQQDEGSNKTIWVGDLFHWMDEEYLANSFDSTGEVASIKVIRNKQNGSSEGYGFVEFKTHAAAEEVLEMYTHSIMPKTNQPYRLNWATFGMGDKRSSLNNNNNGSDLSIFVGDLAADVTDELLAETFSLRYPSVKAAKVVIDVHSNRSKGYGFVRFGDDNERLQAINEMNGVCCSSRRMRIGPATPRKSGYQQYGPSPGGGGYSNRTPGQDGDSTNNKTIFVGGLDPNVSDDDLRQSFSNYGEIVSVKIPIGRGCGFVQFANRSDAEEVLQKLNGTMIGKQSVRLSWGRNQGNRHIRSYYGKQWNGAYYGHFYEGYGYPLPQPHDPFMYAAPYGAYPIYGSHPHQQQVK